MCVLGCETCTFTVVFFHRAPILKTTRFEGRGVRACWPRGRESYISDTMTGRGLFAGGVGVGGVQNTLK